MKINKLYIAKPAVNKMKQLLKRCVLWGVTLCHLVSGYLHFKDYRVKQAKETLI
jgi:hypothetical protein